MLISFSALLAFYWFAGVLNVLEGSDNEIDMRPGLTEDQCWTPLLQWICWDLMGRWKKYDLSLIILNKRMESRLLICGWVRWGELCGGEEEDDNQKTLVGSAGSLVWIWIVVKYHLWTSTTSWGEVGLANRNTSTAKLEKCSLCKANTSFVFKLLQAANEYEAYNISLTCW